MFFQRPEGRVRKPVPVRGFRVDEIGHWWLGSPLSGLILALSLGQIAAWLPQYLTWPWWSDHDVFATMALGWEHGLLPYRDLAGNNFPGTIYLFWIVGKLAGWGRPWAFFALDAVFVVVLGLALLGWSRDRFGRVLPGAIAFASFVAYYLQLDYTQVAQRDWQGPFFTVLALLVAESCQGDKGRWISAPLFAMGVSIRPQTILLWPVIALHVADVGRDGADAEPPRGAILARWNLAVAGWFLFLLLPLIGSGVLTDFLRGVRVVSPGGSYNRWSRSVFVIEFIRQLTMKDLVLVTTILLMTPRAGPALQRSSWTWLLAFVLILLYRPISPSPHAYLDHPHHLIASINLGVVAALILETGSIPAHVRLVMILFILAVGTTLRPLYSNPSRSLQALASLRSGQEPATVPMGYRTHPGVLLAARYSWSDYRQLLNYLRESTRPETRIANALEGVPALTGPTARLPAFPAESVAWLRVKPDDEPRFARQLEDTPNSIVVWSPGEIRGNPGNKGSFTLASIEPVIRRQYERAAAFGPIEVWRRKSWQSSP